MLIVTGQHEYKKTSKNKVCESEIKVRIERKKNAKKKVNIHDTETISTSNLDLLKRDKFYLSIRNMFCKRLTIVHSY